MGPLSGLKIVEIDGLGPVTFAGMVLADLGAEVLRVTRGGGVTAAAIEEVGGDVLFRGRPAVPVDLKSVQDRDRVLDLIAQADGLIEGFRPGVMERLGLGPEVCTQRNPRLVYGRVTGWGQTGPLAPEVGHDINYMSIAGGLYPIGNSDQPPPPPLNMVADYGGGALMLVIGVLAALLEAKAGGKGRVVDAAMVDGVALLTSPLYGLASKGLWSNQRQSNLLDGGLPFYRCYQCQDGGFVSVGALEPRFYAALIQGLGLSPEQAPQFDRAAYPQLQAQFATIFAQRSRDDWAAHFAGTEACVAPVLNLSEATQHPHTQARGTFIDLGCIQPGPAPRFNPPADLPSAPGKDLTIEEALSLWSGS